MMTERRSEKYGSLLNFMVIKFITCVLNQILSILCLQVQGI